MRICQPIKNGKLDPKHQFAMVVDQREPLYWKIFLPIDPKDPMSRWRGRKDLTTGGDIYHYQIVELMGGRPLPPFEYFKTLWPDMMNEHLDTIAPTRKAFVMIYFATMGELLYFRTKIR